jgi:hypothetical protein
VTPEDRTLLSRMAKVNRSLGDLTIALLSRLDEGDLRSADLRSVGRELALLGTDMIRHADALDRVIDSESDHGITAQPPI